MMNFFRKGWWQGITGEVPETADDLLIYALDNITMNDFKRFKDKLSDFTYERKTPIPRGPLENANSLDTKNHLIKTYGKDKALQVAISIFRSINLMGPAEDLVKKMERIGLLNISDESLEVVRKKYMDFIKNKYQQIEDKNARLGEAVLLNRRYTRLRMIKKHRDQEEREHELIYYGRKHLDLMDNSLEEYSPTTMEALFDPGEDGISPATVVLQGPAGIGKTMTVQKIMLDWASGNLYQDRFHFIFYISCREINHFTDNISIGTHISRSNGLQCQHNLIKSIFEDAEKILFIIDGFDELEFPLGNEAEINIDPFQETPKEILLNCLFRKQIFGKSSLIITTRPYTLEKLREIIRLSRYVEIMGFTGENREKYVFNFFESKQQAEKALSLLKQNDTLFTLCTVPITCWIVCTVLKQQIKKDFSLINNTTTSIYVLYLKSLIKYHGRSSSQCISSCIKKFSALAKEGVWNQKIIFEEEDLEKHAVTVSDIASLFLNENIFQRDIETQTCYSFVHLSVQEFFAALYYILSEEAESWDISQFTTSQGEVRPHFTLTVRFLFGLANEKLKAAIGEITQCKVYPAFKSVLEELVTKYRVKHYHNEILNCLYESQDEDFVRRMMSQMVDLRIDEMEENTIHQCLSYCLMKTKCVHSLSMEKCSLNPKSLRALAPGLHNCLSIELRCCDLTSSCCEDLRSVIITSRSLTKLDLRGTNLQDSGLKSLCEGLMDADCTLQEMRLKRCGLTSSCCEDLRSVIITNRSLIKLDLSDNLQDSGLKHLCEGLRHPDCTLQELELFGCGVTSSCCEDLCSVFSTNRSLTKLDLSGNKLQDSGVKCLCEGLRHPDCTLQELWLQCCGLTSSCCEDLRSLIITNRSLTKLHLRGNNLQDSGLKLLCDGLRHPDYTLQELWLLGCGLTSSCCEELHSVIIKNRSLTKLCLSDNLQDSGLKHLCEGLKYPDCTLQELLLDGEDIRADEYRKENGLFPLSHF
ncbi:NACHT, LRR and PYD domains-containing protein 3-like isoform X2 [Pelobates fuscus]|uniref:NACHT, LRR and PYD domains-containing protein 3-like isoform X2 n=1 Tax=Pelobates fuscus TaxID=191477 RepID=UPI002FE450A5